MRISWFVISLALALVPRPCIGQSTPRVVDGDWDDWRGVPALLNDLADAPDAAVDFGEVRVVCDERFIYWMIDFGRTVNAQGLDGSAMILFDADGNSTSGERVHGLDGVDLIVDLSPVNLERPDRPGMGMGVRSTTHASEPKDPQHPPLTVYDVGLMFAPTHAARRIEFRIDRHSTLPRTPALFRSKQFSMKLVFVDAQGKIADETDAVTHDLATCRTTFATNDDLADPLARDATTDFRIMNWNVLRGANFTNPDPFARTIAAIRPDVILLQELPETTTTLQLKEFLTKATHATDWNIVLGTGGGDLRCAIAARLPIQDMLQSIPMPDQPDRTVRAVGAIIERGNKNLLAVAVHLRCCGRAGGPEDQQRLAEARTLSDSILDVVQAHRVDGVVICGDFNLVGSRDPVEVMAAGLDLDHTALRIAHPLCLDGLSHVTWADPKQPFAPGRLDFLLYSDSRLEIGRAFVYDSQHLAAKWLAQYSVNADDSSASSDHRPIVADLHWTVASPSEPRTTQEH